MQVVPPPTAAEARARWPLKSRRSWDRASWRPHCCAQTLGGAPSAAPRDDTVARAAIEFKEGRFEAARVLYTEAVGSSRQNARRAVLLINRAACALKSGDREAAINDCTAALTLLPPDGDVRHQAILWRARAFAEVGDVESARRDLRTLPTSNAAAARLSRRLDEERELARTAASPRSTAAARACRRVSCISPTTVERHLFHECALYRCFAAQTYADLELIVVDTGPAPSPFFTSRDFDDGRVTYVHRPGHLTIGEKRNLAIGHASGDVICHFDDDDLYAPEYVATMVAAMERDGADFVKLSSWLVHDLQTGSTGRFDADGEWPNAALAGLRDNFVYTYGFSYLYRRDLFPTFSFAATSWGEDQDILHRVRQARHRISPRDHDRRVIRDHRRRDDAPLFGTHRRGVDSSSTATSSASACTTSTARIARDPSRRRRCSALRSSARRSHLCWTRCPPSEPRLSRARMSPPIRARSHCPLPVSFESIPRRQRCTVRTGAFRAGGRPLLLGHAAGRAPRRRGRGARGVQRVALVRKRILEGEVRKARA